MDERLHLYFPPLGDLPELAMRKWPAGASRGKSATFGNWCALMGTPGTPADEAFHAYACDLLGCLCTVWAVQHRFPDVPWVPSHHLVTFRPVDSGTTPLWRLEFGQVSGHCVHLRRSGDGPTTDDFVATLAGAPGSFSLPVWVEPLAVDVVPLHTVGELSTLIHTSLGECLPLYSLGREGSVPADVLSVLATTVVRFYSRNRRVGNATIQSWLQWRTGCGEDALVTYLHRLRGCGLQLGVFELLLTTLAFAVNVFVFEPVQCDSRGSRLAGLLLATAQSLTIVSGAEASRSYHLATMSIFLQWDGTKCEDRPTFGPTSLCCSPIPLRLSQGPVYGHWSSTSSGD